MVTEIDIWQSFVVPKLQASGWDFDFHSIAERGGFTDGCIVVRSNIPGRKIRNSVKAIPIAALCDIGELIYEKTR